MANSTTIITGEHPTLGKMFAAVDPAATYIQPKVAELRFAALLAPFPSQDAAKAALLEAGADLGEETK